ncbi:MAG: hypothetical protein WCR52_18920, partial [Bacteroidota bacterium]
MRFSFGLLTINDAKLRRCALLSRSRITRFCVPVFLPAFGTGDGGRWTGDGGRGTVDGGRWTVDGGRGGLILILWAVFDFVFAPNFVFKF